MKASKTVDNANQKLSNTYQERGTLQALCEYLWPNCFPQNFTISGGIKGERYQPLLPVLSVACRKMPVIMIHRGSRELEHVAISAMKNANINGEKKLRIINQANPVFEPFRGMGDMQVNRIIKALAEKLNYSLTPGFEKIVYAHLEILHLLEIPVSLTGLVYLCSFRDMAEFHANIMQLPCEERIARRIWSDLGIEGDENNGQFDLFRNVIRGLQEEAMRSGWTRENGVTGLNCIETMQNGGVLLLSVNDMHSNLLMTYLTEELKEAGAREFTLILDDVKIIDENLLSFLERAGDNCHIGIISDNIVNMFEGNKDHFQLVMEKMNCIVLFKHSTGSVAQTLSDLIGKYDYTRIDSSHGTNQGFFNILPQGRHEEIHYSIENRYRVMPEEIINLYAQQAIVFDTRTNEIIFYN